MASVPYDDPSASDPLVLPSFSVAYTLAARPGRTITTAAMAGCAQSIAGA